MSIKIYNGLRATDRNVFRTQRRIKEVLEPIFLAKFDAALRTALANKGKPWDEVFPSLFPRTEPGTEQWHEPIAEEADYYVAEKLYDLIVALQNTRTHTFTDLDFGYEVSLMPNGRGDTLAPLVLVFSERGGNDYRDALESAGVVEEYGYWNNTDKPEVATEREWRKRKKAWGTIQTPAGDGLRIQMPSRIDAAYRALSERTSR